MKKNRRRQDAAGHPAGDVRTVEDGGKAAIGTSGDDAETQQEKKQSGVNGHGVLVKSAIEIVHTVEIAKKVDQGKKDDAKRQKLRGPRALGGFQIEQDEGDAEKKKRDAGGEGQASGIGNASGVQGVTEKKSSK